jgi:cobalamin biosynthesis protein CbiG
MMALGIGLSSRASEADLLRVTEDVLTVAGWEWEDIAIVGTTSRLAHDSRLAALGRPVLGFADPELAAVAVPTPRGPTLTRLGIPAVAEAAALLAAGPDAAIVVPKVTGHHVTVAAAASGFVAASAEGPA